MEWDHSFSIGTDRNQKINDILIIDDKIVAVGEYRRNNQSDPRPIIMVFDTLGNLLITQKMSYDSLPYGRFFFIEEIHNSSNFIVGGNTFQAGIWNNDILIKMDTSLNEIWSARFTLPSFYYGARVGTVLKDESIIIAGDVLTSFDDDLVVRKIDSLGNLVWENIFFSNGAQSLPDIVEMMDGSIVISVRDGSNYNKLVRLDYDGNILAEYSEYNDTFQSFICLNQKNHLLKTEYNPLNHTSISNYIILSDSFYINPSSIGINTGRAAVDQDTNVIFPYFDGQNAKINYSNFYDPSPIWDIDFGPPGPNVKTCNSIEILQNGGAILAGQMALSNTDYWIAKCNGVGKRWEPDPCEFSPPIADFTYNFSNPILSLQNNSNSGLLYLDTIYSTNWNFSIAPSENGDSVQLFVDTATYDSIEIELIVSNWYGCVDTLLRTINFNALSLEGRNEIQAKVYPNPSQGQISVQLASIDNPNAFIEIHNLIGIKVFEGTLDKKVTDLNLDFLNSGVYNYLIKSDNKSKRGKLIILK